MKELLYLIAICKRADNFEHGWVLLKRWYGEFYWGDKSENHFNSFEVEATKVIAENLIGIIERVRKNWSGDNPQYCNLISSISPTNYSEYGETKLLKKEPSYDFWLRVVAVFFSKLRLTGVEDLEYAGLWNNQVMTPIILETDMEYISAK